MQNFAPDYGGVGLDPALVWILSAVALVVPLTDSKTGLLIRSDVS